MATRNSKSSKGTAGASGSRSAPRRRLRIGPVAVGAVTLGAMAFIYLTSGRGSGGGTGPTANGNPLKAPALPSATALQTNSSSAEFDTSRLEVAHAVMVTVELDFGPKVPSVAEGLVQIERRYQPADGVGRTFAILDAYGEPAANGKLHMSMHVSTEKPGMGSLVFKRTGEVLWRSQIVNGTNGASATFANKGLVVLLDNGAGHTVTVDGSDNPRSILEANVKEMNVPVGQIWPEGIEREVTFLYSACGCPVKVMAVRAGDKTFRTKELPVIFPDDPAVVTVIKRLMRWD
jgi:hypothetical protein